MLRILMIQLTEHLKLNKKGDQSLLEGKKDLGEREEKQQRQQAHDIAVQQNGGSRERELGR